MASKALRKDAKIVPERKDEALQILDSLIIQLIVNVLDEKQIIERHILKERLANLVQLSNHDEELKETMHALVNQL
ncbi:phosphate-starvation-inducible protein PsiE [Ureibacillus thermophilus]|uniref:Phosphate-starvation-inducible protein PsiE n=1 Tax=Ureibacillus thermophilus TaxID=367743 RepID=A0A4P6UUG3_9BACL|nr:phosphate-starvation-inducible protein PsiE [Ureibacillus thermophilus]QBK25192.1 phosphate-starvation-inducible protein PsiE [Ureibacillus thermophilus]